MNRPWEEKLTGEADIGLQIAAFVQAPIPYIAEALLVAGITWTVSRTLTSDTLDTLRERINLVTERLKKTDREAEEIRSKLAVAQDLLRARLVTLQTGTETARTNLTSVMRRHTKVLAVRLAFRRRFLIPNGAQTIAPTALIGAPNLNAEQ